jgi:hypothetical protein
MPLLLRHLAAAVLPLASAAAGIVAVGIAVQLPSGPPAHVSVPLVQAPVSPEQAVRSGLRPTARPEPPPPRRRMRPLVVPERASAPATPSERAQPNVAEPVPASLPVPAGKPAPSEEQAPVSSAPVSEAPPQEAPAPVAVAVAAPVQPPVVTTVTTLEVASEPTNTQQAKHDHSGAHEGRSARWPKQSKGEAAFATAQPQPPTLAVPAGESGDDHGKEKEKAAAREAMSAPGLAPTVDPASTAPDPRQAADPGGQEDAGMEKGRRDSGGHDKSGGKHGP